MNRTTKHLVYSAVLLAIALILPMITGQIPKIGNMLCPMHIPVMLCGYICGWPWGLAVGFIAPLLRGVIFGVPPFIPKGLAMACELATYGFICGILFRSLRKKYPETKEVVHIYITLIVAMLAGRLVWGLMRYLLAPLTGEPFTLELFIAGGFATAIPGIIIQLILIPVLVTAIRKSKVLYDK